MNKYQNEMINEFESNIKKSLEEFERNLTLKLGGIMIIVMSIFGWIMKH